MMVHTTFFMGPSLRCADPYYSKLYGRAVANGRGIKPNWGRRIQNAKRHYPGGNKTCKNVEPLFDFLKKNDMVPA
ncbi:MAG: hypothetical protein LBJ83_01665 [Oscillospiraceae bacterium]|jgi:hypothetical protein|nr:hypothetical protein [Oscillospiraceae bacterium]